MEYKIDATGKKLGRIASQAALLLTGKNKADFQRHILPKSRVMIENASKMSLDPEKFSAKIYKRFSGYPGGLKHVTTEKIISKKGYGEILRIAIKRMVPSNRLRDKIMKNLSVKE